MAIFCSSFTSKDSWSTGRCRAYGNTVVVRAVQAGDAMTAQAAEIPYSVLKKISER